MGVEAGGAGYGLPEEDREVVSKTYEQMVKRADPSTLDQWTKKAREKAGEVTSSDVPDELEQSLDHLQDLIEYAESEPNDALIRRLLIASFRYFVDPWDIIPDAIPQEGLRDDLFVIDRAHFQISEAQHSIADEFASDLNHVVWRLEKRGKISPEILNRLRELADDLKSGHSVTEKKKAFLEATLGELVSMPGFSEACPDGKCPTCERLSEALA